VKLAGISVVIAVGIALVIIVYATLFVVCILFIRKYVVFHCFKFKTFSGVGFLSVIIFYCRLANYTSV